METLYMSLVRDDTDDRRQLVAAAGRVAGADLKRVASLELVVTFSVYLRFVADTLHTTCSLHRGVGGCRGKPYNQIN